MRRSEAAGEPRSVDWAGWLALAWALIFGVRYVRTVLRARASGLWERLIDLIAS